MPWDPLSYILDTGTGIDYKARGISVGQSNLFTVQNTQKIQCKVAISKGHIFYLYFTPENRPLPMPMVEDAFFRVGYT